MWFWIFQFQCCQNHFSCDEQPLCLLLEHHSQGRCSRLKVFQQFLALFHYIYSKGHKTHEDPLCGQCGCACKQCAKMQVRQSPYRFLQHFVACFQHRQKACFSQTWLANGNSFLLHRHLSKKKTRHRSQKMCLHQFPWYMVCLLLGFWFQQHSSRFLYKTLKCFVWFLECSCLSPLFYIIKKMFDHVTFFETLFAFCLDLIYIQKFLRFDFLYTYATKWHKIKKNKHFFKKYLYALVFSRENRRQQSAKT